MEPVKKIVHLLFVYDGIVKPCLIVSDNRIIEIEIIEFKRTSRSEVIDRLHIGLIIQPDILIFRCIDNRIVAYNVLLTDGDTLFHSAHSLEKTPIPHIYYRVDHRKSLVGKKMLTCIVQNTILQMVKSTSLQETQEILGS